MSGSLTSTSLLTSTEKAAQANSTTASSSASATSSDASTTASSALTSGGSLVGQTANFTGTQIPLQSGAASINFTTGSAEPIAIAVTDASGAVVRTVQQTSTAGSNTWNWDGMDDAGNKLADGTYGIAVQTQDSSGNVTAVPFTATGTITGISKSSTGGVLLQLGSDSVDMTNVNSFSSAASAGTTS